jgi:dTDP-glucose 4,6-dehydratase
VFGSLSNEDPPFTEQSPYEPNSPYSASKASSDHFVRAYHHTYNMPVTLSNCSNNYGPNQHREKLIPTVIHACLEQKPIPIYGSGENIRDWIHVEDHCRAVWEVVTRGKIGESYNIGANNEWKNIDVVRLICKIMDELKPHNAPHEKLITFVEDRKGHDWRYAVGTVHQEFFTEKNMQPREAMLQKMRRYIQECF